MNPDWTSYLLKGAGFELLGGEPEDVHVEGDTLVWHGGGLWPAPLDSTDAEHAASWLDARHPPDCRGGSIEGDRTLLYGAAGSVAYAVEEHFPVAGAGCLSNTLQRSLVLAQKAESFARGVMPRREFGWRRPFLVVGSTLEQTGRVLTWHRELEAMVMDPVLSDLWLSVVQDPRDDDSYDILVRRMARTFQQSFLSWIDDLPKETS